MSGTKNVTKRQIANVLLFVLFFFVPLFIIPVFPESRILQALDSNGASVLLLAVLAGCASSLLTWVMFRQKTKT
jgi:hypothetical protein